ncbi:MAG: iron-containing redox enzyme family protein [Myxococcales bacterium]|nr:iron-containing redox enzyme family protein [Myxococcales bacterium]
MTSPELDALDAHVKGLWKELLARPAVATFLTGPAIRDRRSYAIYLTQAYHYTSHTPRNQGLVAVRPDLPVAYRKFCLSHAEEEVGHELMALHDLRALGVTADPSAFPLLPATEMKIAYLYWIAQHGNPVARLGYSFWAENSYGPGGPFLEGMRQSMGLTAAQTTFFDAHADIDAKHGDDVRRVLVKACRTPEDWEAVHRAAQITMRTSFDMLEQELQHASALIAGEPSPFAFLDADLAGAAA